jgi:hypothetical protein
MEDKSLGFIRKRRKATKLEIKAGYIAAQQAILSQFGYNFCKSTLLDAWTRRKRLPGCSVLCLTGELTDLPLGRWLEKTTKSGDRSDRRRIVSRNT